MKKKTLSHAKIAQMGGLKCKANRGINFYREIGRKGGIKSGETKRSRIAAAESGNQ